ncbi:MAG: hypothetical protein WAM28_03205 [Chlamydiales bacterium]
MGSISQIVHKLLTNNEEGTSELCLKTTDQVVLDRSNFSKTTEDEQEMTKKVSLKCFSSPNMETEEECPAFEHNQLRLSIQSATQIINLMKEEEEKIAKIHLHVCDSQQRERQSLPNSVDITELVDEAVISLEKMKKAYSENEANLTEAEKLDYRQRLRKAQSQIQKMNAFAQKMTVQDVMNVATFFHCPNGVGKVYEDDDGERYYEPDHSQLLLLGSRFMSQDLYKGIGLHRKFKILNEHTKKEQNCDLLYFKKKEDQIDYDVNGEGFFSFLTQQKSRMERRREEQSKLLKKFSDYLSSNSICSQWHYECFRAADFETFKRFGFSVEKASGVNAIIFYHRKAEEGEVHPI